MEQNTESFWQLVENTQEKSGSFAALILIFIFGVVYFGSCFLAAWAVSVTFGTAYWWTVLSIVLLKLVWG
jgi:hypothetical protein